LHVCLPSRSSPCPYTTLFRSQVVVADVEAVHVHIHRAGVHRHLVALPLDLHGLGRGGLGAGLPGQLAEGHRLFVPLFVGLVLVFAAVVLAGALLALGLVLVLGLGLAGAAVAAVLAGGGVAALGVRLGLAVLAVAVLAAACAV